MKVSGGLRGGVQLLVDSNDEDGIGAVKVYVIQVVICLLLHPFIYCPTGTSCLPALSPRHYHCTHSHPQIEYLVILHATFLRPIEVNAMVFVADIPANRTASRNR
jgi:hypothetical protein